MLIGQLNSISYQKVKNLTTTINEVNLKRKRYKAIILGHPYNAQEDLPARYLDYLYYIFHQNLIMELRNYQKNAVQSVISHFKESNLSLIVNKC